jgi:diadenosine tetraphosphatase ApaH/serine/threonine PP2A family protein phosphatase
MLIALLTDLHANREALAACLAHAERLKAERYAFLGDLVGYGANPGWVLDTVIAFVERGAIAVLGNHDAAVLHGPRKTMNRDAQEVIAWTRAQLTVAQMKFIAGLPLQVEDGERLFVHANAWAPARWEYVLSAFDARSSMAATRCRLTFCGHVHEPALYHMGMGWRPAAFTPIVGVGIPLSAPRRWLAIPGSVGQPRDGIPAACYALFDTATSKLTYFRVPYDFESAARKIRNAGLPERFVVLLEEGR